MYIYNIPDWLLYFLAFIWGTIWGSFYNVCIYRIPNKISIAYPPSHCPVCGHKLKWYDNIPVISYIMLRGRCRYCGTKISPRYPLVEALTGLISILVLWRASSILEYFIYFFLSGCLLVISFIDWDTFTIPDTISYSLLVIGLVLLFLQLLPVKILDGIIGLLFGGGLPLIIAITFEKIKKMEQPALGGGDIKLFAITGTFMGLYGVLFTMIIGSILGIIVGYPLVLLTGKKVDEEELREKRYIPFGPFIAVAAIITYLIGVDNLVQLLLI